MSAPFIWEEQFRRAMDQVYQVAVQNTLKMIIDECDDFATRADGTDPAAVDAVRAIRDLCEMFGLEEAMRA